MHSAAAAFIKLSSVKTDPSPESWILDSPLHSSRELFLFLQADHWRRDTSPNTCGTYLSLIWPGATITHFPSLTRTSSVVKKCVFSKCLILIYYIQLYSLCKIQLTLILVMIESRRCLVRDIIVWPSKTILIYDLLHWIILVWRLVLRHSGHKCHCQIIIDETPAEHIHPSKQSPCKNLLVSNNLLRQTGQYYLTGFYRHGLSWSQCYLSAPLHSLTPEQQLTSLSHSGSADSSRSFSLLRHNTPRM